MASGLAEGNWRKGTVENCGKWAGGRKLEEGNWRKET